MYLFDLYYSSIACISSAFKSIFDIVLGALDYYFISASYWFIYHKEYIYTTSPPENAINISIYSYFHYFDDKTELFTIFKNI